MTREEREEFVRRAWYGRGTLDDGIKKIVDEWENDCANSFNDGVTEGRLSGWSEK